MPSTRCSPSPAAVAVLRHRSPWSGPPLRDIAAVVEDVPVVAGEDHHAPGVARLVEQQPQKRDVARVPRRRELVAAGEVVVDRVDDDADDAPVAGELGPQLAREAAVRVLQRSLVEQQRRGAARACLDEAGVRGERLGLVGGGALHERPAEQARPREGREARQRRQHERSPVLSGGSQFGPASRDDVLDQLAGDAVAHAVEHDEQQRPLDGDRCDDAIEHLLDAEDRAARGGVADVRCEELREPQVLVAAAGVGLGDERAKLLVERRLAGRDAQRRARPVGVRAVARRVGQRRRAGPRARLSGCRASASSRVVMAATA